MTRVDLAPHHFGRDLDLVRSGHVHDLALKRLPQHSMRARLADSSSLPSRQCWIKLCYCGRAVLCLGACPAASGNSWNNASSVLLRMKSESLDSCFPFDSPSRPHPRAKRCSFGFGIITGAAFPSAWYSTNLQQRARLVKVLAS